jgi:DNA-binding Lrp family transcriptional regulator
MGLRELDDMDKRLLLLLKADGRASVASLAVELGVTRATVRARMERLRRSGDLLGFTAILKGDVAARPVRGIVLIEIAGRAADRATRTLLSIPEVEAVHSTHGRWDLVVDLGADTLEALDAVLNRIRAEPGIERSETSLFLSTRR